MLGKKKVPKTKIFYASFNKDKSCLSLGMQKGYRIYDLTQDLTKKRNLYYYERILGKSIGIIEMLEKTNILALSEGGDGPYMISKVVRIFDDREGKDLTELTFRTGVIHIRLKKDRMLVVCENSIYIIGLANFRSIDSISLGEEKRKIIPFAFSLEQQVNKLAFNIINSKENIIKINTYDAENRKTSIEMKSNFKPNNVIKYMEFNKKGKILAVAVKHYPYVELFNTETGLIICKCQIDSDNLNINYISFSQDNDFLCCFSESGEANVFNIKSAFDIQEEEENEELINLNGNENENNVNTKLKIWTKFYLPENKVICTFANFLENEIGKNYIICIGTKGNYYLVKLNKDKNENLSLKVCEKYFLKNDTELNYDEEFV